MLDYPLKPSRIPICYRDQDSSSAFEYFVSSCGSSDSFGSVNLIAPPPTRQRHVVVKNISSMSLLPPSTASDGPYSASPPSSPSFTPTIIPPPPRFRNPPPEAAKLTKVPDKDNRNYGPPRSESMLMSIPRRDRVAQAGCYPPNKVYNTTSPRLVTITDVLRDIERETVDGRPVGKYRRRRSSPVHFQFENVRQPLSPRLVWYARHGDLREAILKEKELQGHLTPVAQHDTSKQVQPESVESDEDEQNRKLMETIANLPKLPKLEKPGTFLVGPGGGGRGDGVHNNAGRQRRKLVMTRIEKLALLTGQSPRRYGVPPQQVGRLGQDQMASYLPRDLLSEPMRFRPIFKKAVKKSIQKKEPEKAVPAYKPPPKKLPIHLLYGNFKVWKAHERSTPLMPPPFRSAFRVEKKL